jgi:predicted transcriptional regulator
MNKQQEVGYLCHALDSTAAQVIEQIQFLSDEDRHTVQSVIERLRQKIRERTDA